MQTGTTGVDPQTTTDTAAIGRLAFKHIVAGEYEAARPLIARGLGLEPRNAVLAHARAHLTTDTGAFEEGAAYLRAFLEGDDASHGLHAHNSWHLADLELELGRPGAALARYRRAVGPRVAELPMTFFSAVSFLWRLELYGYGAAGRARGAPLPWAELLPVALGLTEASPLDETARAMTFLATGEAGELAGLVERHRASPAAGGGGAAPVVPLVLGLRAFWQGDYALAADQLGRLAPAWDGLGGIPDQLLVFEDTLAEAELRAGRFAAAEAGLRRRRARRQAPRVFYWLGRAQRGLGRTDEARASLGAARLGWQGAERDCLEVVALEGASTAG